MFSLFCFVFFLFQNPQRQNQSNRSAPRIPDPEAHASTCPGTHGGMLFCAQAGARRRVWTVAEGPARGFLMTAGHASRPTGRTGRLNGLKPSWGKSLGERSRERRCRPGVEGAGILGAPCVAQLLLSLGAGLSAGRGHRCRRGPVSVWSPSLCAYPRARFGQPLTLPAQHSPLFLLRASWFSPGDSPHQRLASCRHTALQWTHDPGLAVANTASAK